MTTDLVRLNPTEIRTIATDAVKSGFFAGIRNPEQAFMAILAGQEIGLAPFQSMSQFHIIKGKPIMSAGLLAALIKRSGKYRYRVTEHTREACTIALWELFGSEWLEAGESRYTMEDAQRAGLLTNPTWKAHPRNMLFARALANLARWFCGDATGGVVYVEGELDDAEPEPVREPAPRPARRTVKVVEAEVIDVAEAPRQIADATGVSKALHAHLRTITESYGVDATILKEVVHAACRKAGKVGVDAPWSEVPAAAIGRMLDGLVSTADAGLRAKLESIATYAGMRFGDEDLGTLASL